MKDTHMTSTASDRAPQGRAAPRPRPATASVTSIPAGIVADERWPQMYRVKLGRGQLSGMCSLARAKDALASRR